MEPPIVRGKKYKSRRKIYRSWKNYE